MRRKRSDRILRKIRKEIKNLPENFIILFVTTAKNYMKVNLSILRVFVNEKKFYGIYVTINRPYNSLVKLLKKEGININRMFFIDCISETVGGKMEMRENCLFLASPKNLTELGIALTEATSGIGGKANRFLFLDSLSTMAIYNSFTTLTQFAHFLTARIRLHGLKAGILISLERSVDKKLLLTISQLCDRVVEVR